VRKERCPLSTSVLRLLTLGLCALSRYGTPIRILVPRYPH
jgi:hypothetical protein